MGEKSFRLLQRSSVGTSRVRTWIGDERWWVRYGRPAVLLVFVLAPLDFVGAAEVCGWVERVRLEPYGIVLRAKIDTGAKNSSLNASDIEFFSKNGIEYARFRVVNDKGATAVLEHPVVREAKIKQRQGKSEQRPVIRLSICLGNVRKKVEVNLVDRSGFNYQMLIGRSFLKGDFVVDPSQTLRFKPRCAR